MVLTLRIERKYFFAVLIGLVLVLGGAGVYAQFPNPGHSIQQVDALVKSCTSGKFVKAIDSTGIICDTPPQGGGGGGTITGVFTGPGTGLKGEGTSGDVYLGLMDCTNGLILKRSGGTWVCAADQTGGGEGDNLGNHRMTQALHTQGYAIQRTGSSTASVSPQADYIQIDGDYLNVEGDIKTGGYLPTGGSSHICRASGDGLYGSCSSSIRYKKDVVDFDVDALKTVEQLRPVTFTWKKSGERDFGLIAEEVEKVNPLFATYSEEGIVEGVKYDQLVALLIDAIKEQQAQIKAQDQYIRSQQWEIYELESRITKIEEKLK